MLPVNENWTYEGKPGRPIRSNPKEHRHALHELNHKTRNIISVNCVACMHHAYINNYYMCSDHNPAGGEILKIVLLEEEQNWHGNQKPKNSIF